MLPGGGAWPAALHRWSVAWLRAVLQPGDVYLCAACMEHVSCSFSLSSSTSFLLILGPWCVAVVAGGVTYGLCWLSAAFNLHLHCCFTVFFIRRLLQICLAQPNGVLLALLLAARLELWLRAGGPSWMPAAT